MRGFLITLLACAVVLAWPVPAHAHTALKDASPGPGDKVAPGVNVISLTFDKLKPGTTPKIGMLGPDQTPVTIGEPVTVNTETVCATVTPLRPGVHTITYTVQADDNDVQDSKFFFTVAPDGQAAGTPTACQKASLPAPGAQRNAAILGLDSRAVLAGLAIAGSACVVGIVLVMNRSRRSGRGRRSRRHASTW